MSVRRILVTVATTSLIPLGLVAIAGPSTYAESPTLRAGGYSATITRTEHGIPHVVADDWGSLGFGHGYETAGTNLCNLADTLVPARGERSRWFGPDERYEDHVTLS